ncbi:MAG: hypothetical protein ACR2J1_07060 [Methyloceanibacter sp.]|uniref:hypothetical protein n=1 Tax=Methyloceanibacter sp. TaxID=1965321 RepID=UPI003D9AC9AB
MISSLSSRALTCAVLAASLLGVGGCGGVEFQGKVFDYMGVSGDGTKEDVRMTERAPLLLPPNLKALPQPGAGTAVATARPDWPTNPEVQRKRVAEVKAAEASKAEAEADPINPYAGKPTLLDKVFGKKKTTAEPVADVPEPDPTDKTPGQKPKASSVAATQRTDPTILAPPPTEDPFHPSAPSSYETMSNPSGNDATN